MDRTSQSKAGRGRPPIGASRGRAGRPIPLLVLMVVALCGYLVAVLAVNAFSYVYERLGIPPAAMIVILVSCLLGSLVDVPVARLRGRTVVTRQVWAGGLVWADRLHRTGDVLVLVNVGGALIPTAVSVYVVVHDPLGWQVWLAVVMVAVVVHLVARTVPGVGVVSPALVPPASAALSAVVLGGPSPAAVAFVAGTLGTVIGADLLNLPRLRRAGARVVSIGGAGTFDGVFLAGIGAVLLATI